MGRGEFGGTEGPVSVNWEASYLLPFPCMWIPPDAPHIPTAGGPSGRCSVVLTSSAQLHTFNTDLRVCSTAGTTLSSS